MEVSPLVYIGLKPKVNHQVPLAHPLRNYFFVLGIQTKFEVKVPWEEILSFLWYIVRDRVQTRFKLRQDRVL